MASREHAAPEREHLPAAKTKRRRGSSFFWLIPLFAAGVAAWLIYREFGRTGFEITVRFKDVSGIEAGKAPLVFRGVKVGRVEEIELTENRKRAILTLSVKKPYQDLCRQGSQFWIVRPEISAGEIRGLLAITSQNYVEMQLGEGDEQETEFVGMERSPVTAETHEAVHGLRFRLLAPQRWGLKGGTPILYRGVEVGSVLSYQLLEQSWAVAFDVIVREKYVPLVTMNSKFWKASGFDIDAGLFSGLDVQMDSFETLFSGGIEFATPPGHHPPASSNAIFHLHQDAEPEWRKWAAEIEIEANPSSSRDHDSEPVEGRLMAPLRTGAGERFGRQTPKP